MTTPNRAARLRKLWNTNRDVLSHYLRENGKAVCFDRLPSDASYHGYAADWSTPMVPPTVAFTLRTGWIGETRSDRVRVACVDAEGFIVEGPVHV